MGQLGPILWNSVMALFGVVVLVLACIFIVYGYRLHRLAYARARDAASAQAAFAAQETSELALPFPFRPPLRASREAAVCGPLDVRLIAKESPEASARIEQLARDLRPPNAQADGLTFSSTG